MHNLTQFPLPTMVLIPHAGGPIVLIIEFPGGHEVALYLLHQQKSWLDPALYVGAESNINVMCILHGNPFPDIQHPSGVSLIKFVQHISWDSVTSLDGCRGNVAITFPTLPLPIHGHNYLTCELQRFFCEVRIHRSGFNTTVNRLFRMWQLEWFFFKIAQVQALKLESFELSCYTSVINNSLVACFSFLGCALFKQH